MTAPIRVLAAIDSGIEPALVEAAINAAPGLELAGTITQEREWESRELHVHDALLIACMGDESEALAAIAAASADPQRRPIVVAVAEPHQRFISGVLEAGADDIVVLGSPERASTDIGFAIQKAMARRSGPVGAVAGIRQGGLIVVLGPKGGTGKTLTAANLTTALALSGRRVTLVDLDLQFGDLGLVMGLAPEKTIYDLVTAGGTVDAEKVEAFTCQHVSGARVLLAPTRPDHAHVVRPDFLRELYGLLRASNDFVVVDTPPGFTPEVITTIDASSHVCLLGMLDAPSLKNAKLGLETLELMGYPSERIRVVLNRADTNVGISHADVVSVIGRAPDVLVPSHRDVVRSINAGEPLVMAKSRTEAGKAFRALADLFIGTTPKIEVAKSRNGRPSRLLARA